MQRLKTTASCPSCGAPFELLEGANVARCPYCNLPLLLQSKKKILRYYLEPKVERRSISFLVDRYRKENRESLPKRIDKARLFFLPFWRFTAQAFYTIISRPHLSLFQVTTDEEKKTEEVSVKDWDVNFIGHTSNHLCIATLGMRPDWLKLRILESPDRLERKGEVLSLEVDSSTARERMVESLRFYLEEKKTADDELVFRLIEERLSLIYFPLWVVDFVAPEGKFFHVIDGVTGRAFKQSCGNFKQRKSRSDDVEKFSPLRIVPHRCPNCGWDLPVKPFHLVYPCENCRRIWKTDAEGYGETKGEVARFKEESNLSVTEPFEYYPFWILEMGLGRKRSSSIQEVFKLLPSEIGLFRITDKSRPFLFCIPAFELGNLKKIADIALAYARTQPDLETERTKGENLKRVFISDEDAKKVAELLWLVIISQKVNLDPTKWKKVRLRAKKIIWCPCHKEGTFLIDAAIGYSFQKVG